MRSERETKKRYDLFEENRGHYSVTAAKRQVRLNQVGIGREILTAALCFPLLMWNVQGIQRSLYIPNKLDKLGIKPKDPEQKGKHKIQGNVQCMILKKDCRSQITVLQQVLSLTFSVKVLYCCQVVSCNPFLEHEVRRMMQQVLCDAVSWHKPGVPENALVTSWVPAAT